MATYPAFPTLSGQKVTVDWLMNNPVVIHRTMRTLAQQRLIGDRLLTGRVDLTGSGAVIFGVSEGLFPSRAAERISPNGEYPLTDDGPETPASAVTDTDRACGLYAHATSSTSHSWIDARVPGRLSVHASFARSGR